MITNTHSVGVVRDSVIQWRVAHGQPDPAGYWWSLPVVAETWDGWLNDINGFHVKSTDAFHAIDSASSGPVTEGNVGGGTGMVCNEFKGGIGTSSRKLDAKFGGYTVGVLAVQLWIAPESAHRWRAGGQRNSRGPRLRLDLI
jgi:D-aminopeptidase